MNAVIALCHFCEVHGPQILFCTQPFHCANHSPDEIQNGAIEPTPSSCGINQSRVSSPAVSDESLGTPDEVELPMSPGVSPVSNATFTYYTLFL